MSWNYDGKRFRVATNSGTGQTGSSTTFLYRQRQNILWGTYEGGAIAMGTLTGLVAEDGTLEFHYSHVSDASEIRSGVCRSTPEILPDGRIQLLEKWRWTPTDCSNADCSEGESVIVEEN